ncbi:MAG: acyl carrier protein [Thermoguttaceae bacterium]|nr:acyl carrier protein [Thermoguttaceae bacterium]MDW8079939.1 acyl carrier protein [Thermoguttaceae bacterium]
MTEAEIRQLVLGIIADIVPDQDLSQIRDDEPLRDQLGLDSMDFLDIVMELRRRYRMQIPEEDYPRLATVAGTIEYLKPRLAQLAPG